MSPQRAETVGGDGLNRLMRRRDDLREAAIALRLQGLSTRQIAEKLGIPNTSPLARMLVGVPPADWTKRPRAKDAEKARARELRMEGWSYVRIAEALDVSKGSVSLWVHDLPAPVRARPEQVPSRVLSADELKDLAVTYRRAGRSRAEIRRALGIGDERLARLLEGVPTEEWRSRSRGVGHLRDRARSLRSLGWSHTQIAEELEISTSSSANLTAGLTYLAADNVDDTARPQSRVMRRRESTRDQQKLDAANRVAELTSDVLLAVAAVAYWCEGSKSKTYDRRESLTFVNSDPSLIQLWMRFLREMSVEDDRIRCRLQIHETADVDRALREWAEIVEMPLERFGKTTLKRHQPKTNRRNIGDDYRGCLAITVLKGADLYRLVEGTYRGVISRALTLPLGARASPIVGDWQAEIVDHSAMG